MTFPRQDDIKKLVINKQFDEIRKKDLEVYQLLQNKSMDKLIKDIAHQWRQPLNGISLCASALSYELSNGSLNDERIKKYTSEIVNGTSYLSSIIEKFLRLDRKNLDNYEKVTIQKEIDDALKSVKKRIDEKNISLNLDIKKELVYKKIVSGYLADVLVNILTNAIDVLVQRDIINPYIVLKMDVINDEVQFHIEDNAGGIDEELISNLFLSYTTTKHKSLDIGLSLFYSYKLIKYIFNGELSAKNSLNGAIFSIKFNIFNEIKNLKVMYIEENSDERIIFDKLLKRYVSEVISVSDGQKAFDILVDNSDYDLVILDINIPKINAFELIKKIKQLNSNTEIFVTSSNLDYAKKNVLEQLEIKHNFNKPIEFSILINKIKEVLKEV